MKKICLIILILLFTAGGPAYAVHDPDIPKEPPTVTGSISVSFMSDFVARGRKLGGEPAIQPSLTLNYGPFSFNYWQNNDTDDDSRTSTQGHATESDLTATYFKQFDKVGIVLGALYIAGHDFADTTRWIGGITVDTLLKPSITAYWDTDEGDGTFYVASISHSFAIPVGSHSIPLNLNAQASYDDGDLYASTDDNGNVIHDWHYGQVSASTSLPVFKMMGVKEPLLQNFFLAPNINYSFALSDKGEEAIKNGSINNEDTILYGGITAGVSF